MHAAEGQGRVVVHRAILLFAGSLQGVLVVDLWLTTSRHGLAPARSVLHCSWSRYDVYDLEIIDFIGCLMRHADTAACGMLISQATGGRLRDAQIEHRVLVHVTMDGC